MIDAERIQLSASEFCVIWKDGRGYWIGRDNFYIKTVRKGVVWVKWWCQVVGEKWLRKGNLRAMYFDKRETER